MTNGELFTHHQPIVFQKELLFWKEFNKFISKPLSNINNSITTNTHIQYSDYIKNNLEIYNLPLSYDWNIDIRNIILNDTSAIFFIKQNNYLQVFGCITGEMRIIIAPPDQIHLVQPFINMVSTVDASSILDKEPMEMNYIEIIVRQGNMIYIPYNLIYFIYNGNSNGNSNDIDNDIDIPQNVAYTRERQLSNFIYQSLEEANNNVNLVSGKGTSNSLKEVNDPYWPVLKAHSSVKSIRLFKDWTLALDNLSIGFFVPFSLINP